MIDEIIAFLNRNYKKPLNVQIEEMKDYLGGYTLEASDVVYIESKNASFSTKEYALIPYKFKLNASGTVRITGTFTKQGSSSHTVYIYKNDVQEKQISTGSSTVLNLSYDMSVEKGDVITLAMKSGSSLNLTLSADSLNICATAVPASQGNLIELIEG
ncbi:MAG: hypothetical protein EGQ35_00340 [Clostridiales bacterium]|nr:hypothetical protein [Clostridiales bacterium]